jgi:maltose O-acetyltransferase
MSEERMRQLEARIEALERELRALRAPPPDPLDNKQRIAAFRRLWTCRKVTVLGSTARMTTPVLLLGEGSITIGDGVQFGYERDQFFLSGYILIDARRDAHIAIGADAVINNNATLIAEGEGIEIGPETLIGASVQIFDTDFHNLDPARRRDPVSPTKKVLIGRNVFLGAHCAVLKGSRIGADSVVGYGSVVTGDIPAGVIAAGSPARVIRPVPRAG